MPKRDPEEIIDSFDPTQVEMIDRAIERAWSVVRYDEHGDDNEARFKLSLCIINEASHGEENHINLVNRAIMYFRRERELTKQSLVHKID